MSEQVEARVSGLQAPRRWSAWQWVAGIAGVIIIALLAGGFMWVQAMQPPDDLDLSTTVMSESASYRVSIVPSQEPVPVNALHTWVVHVETPVGQPVTNAQVDVDGDMPQHKHGMPTVPRVTENLGNGEYLVEGMKFQMGGWWVVEFFVDADGVTDVARFNLVL
jgi:hypothetical protein